MDASRGMFGGGGDDVPFELCMKVRGGGKHEREREREGGGGGGGGGVRCGEVREREER